MKTSKAEKERRERIVSNIRKTWESLESHLDWAVEPHKGKLPEGQGSRKFHADTVRDYAKMVLDLAEDL